MFTFRGLPLWDGNTCRYDLSKLYHPGRTISANINIIGSNWQSPSDYAKRYYTFFTLKLVKILENKGKHVPLVFLRWIWREFDWKNIVENGKQKNFCKAILPPCHDSQTVKKKTDTQFIEKRSKVLEVNLSDTWDLLMKNVLIMSVSSTTGSSQMIHKTMQTTNMTKIIKQMVIVNNKNSNKIIIIQIFKL